MTGLLYICKDLAIGVTEEKYAVSEAIIKGCEIFLRCLVEVKSDLTILPREIFSSSMKRSIEDELLISWLASSTLSENDRNTSLGKKTPSVTTHSMNEKAHLILFAPIAYKLLNCELGEVKDLASLVSSSVDLGSLIISFTDMLNRSEALEAENEILRDEIHKLRSSQHLSF